MIRMAFATFGLQPTDISGKNREPFREDINLEFGTTTDYSADDYAKAALLLVLREFTRRRPGMALIWCACTGMTDGKRIIHMPLEPPAQFETLI